MPITQAELDYWGPPPFPTTIVDEAGFPLGFVQPSGVVSMCQPSRVGQSTFDKWEQKELVVVWDGAKPAKHGRTKGGLLPEVTPFGYIDSLVSTFRMVKTKPEEA